MNDRVYTRENASSSPAARPSRTQLHSHNSTTSITSNPTSSSSSSSTSSNLSNLSLSDVEEADHLPAGASPQQPAGVSPSDAVTGNRSSHRPPARTAYSGLSTIGVGIRGFQNSILSPAQRIAKESVPSPPATSKGGESERGSIGSAQGQTAAGDQRLQDSRNRRPNIPLNDMRAPSSHDSYATIRKSPVAITPAAGQQYGSDLVTSYPQSTQATTRRTPFPVPSSSSKHRPNLNTSSSSSSSNRSDRLSSSPVFPKRSQSSLQHIQNDTPSDYTPSHERLDSSANSNDSSHIRAQMTMNGDSLRRTSSSTSRSSHDGSDLTDYKGKGKENIPSPIERKPSISAKKIRQASEASRARVGVADVKETQRTKTRTLT